MEPPPAGDCGGVDQECCSESCNEGLACLGGSNCSCAAKATGQYVIRGDGSVLFFPVAAQDPPTEILTEDAEPLLDVVEVSGGMVHSCALRADGTVWCWRVRSDGNKNGELGNGDVEASGPLNRASQVMAGANKPLENVESLSAGYAYSTCAVTTERLLYCWGDLTHLANGGTPTIVATAQAIVANNGDDLSDVVQVSVGVYDSCALIDNGDVNEVWCWGLNRAKNLGSGDDVPQRYPVKVPGFDDPRKVVVPISYYLSNSTVCVLDGDRVRCLGFNANGEIGNGMKVASVPAPETVQLENGDPLDEVVDLQPGADTCALRANGTIWCWGAGYKEYAIRVGANNVASLGGDDGALPQYVPRYLTTDGVYHVGNTTREVECRSAE